MLQGINLEIQKGAFVAVTGPSGSGKTTLLGLLAGLDEPTTGSVELDGQDVARMSDDDRARFRVDRIGFVFQTFHLLPTLTALENVMVPLELAGSRARRNGVPARENAMEIIRRVGLQDRARHYPVQLSGGEKQRVALARAFVNRPRILFADEPTGNLDRRTGDKVVELIQELNREESSTLVLVTHDMDLAEKADRVVRLVDGKLFSDQKPAP